MNDITYNYPYQGFVNVKGMKVFFEAEKGTGWGQQDLLISIEEIRDRERILDLVERLEFEGEYEGEIFLAIEEKLRKEEEESG